MISWIIARNVPAQQRGRIGSVRVLGLLSTILVFLSIAGEASAQQVSTQPIPIGGQIAELTRIEESIRRGMERIVAGVDNYPKHRDCFSCHHQAVPLFAISKLSQETASHQIRWGEQADRRDRILEFSRKSLEQQLSELSTDEELDGRGMTLGYALWTMAIGQCDWGPVADKLVGKALATQQFDGRWRIHSVRPPAASSESMATALVVFGLNHYAQLRSESNRDVSDAAIAKATYRALLWRRSQPIPKATEDLCAMLWLDYQTQDFVHRLPPSERRGNLPRPLGLPPKLLELFHRTFTDAEFDKLLRCYFESHKSNLRELLIQTQNTDGGWGYQAGFESDAYSTATALLTLVQSTRYSALTSDFDAPWFQSGVRYLIETQKDDGSWHVSSRATPVQEYFDNGDPHQTDQFISMQATAWAVAALETARRRNNLPLSVGSSR